MDSGQQVINMSKVHPNIKTKNKINTEILSEIMTTYSHDYLLNLPQFELNKLVTELISRKLAKT